MIDLSVIVPIYNVEKYLEECLESIIAIKGIETQIICVDDCSTDDSSHILGKYEKYKNIEIRKNKKNVGLAATRNEGMKYACGRYVLFVDSDDYINADNIASFVKEAEHDSLDALYFDAEEFGDADKMNADKRKRKNRYAIANGLSIFNQMVSNHEMFGSVWSALYRRDFISTENIKFIDGILHEDIPYTFEILNKAKRVSVVNEVGYYYRQRENSILYQHNYLGRAIGLMVGYSRLLYIWNESMQNSCYSVPQESIDAYLTEILLMIQSNIGRSIEEDCTDYSIVNHIKGNIKINEYAKYNKTFKNDVLQELRSCGNVAMYGAGNIATELLQYFETMKIRIKKLFVTSSCDKKKLLNVDIEQYTPEEGSKYDIIIIGVSKLYDDEILCYLKNMGYTGKIIRLAV